MAQPDDDEDDNRTELEKGVERLTSNVRDLFNKITGNETAANDNPTAAQQAQKTQQQYPDPKLTAEQKSQVSAFIFAARRNDIAGMQKYIDAGGDVNAWNIAGETALHIAARQGHLQAAELLIARGADPKKGRRNEPATTPLDEAVNFGKEDIAELLTRHGGYVPGNRVEGRTLLHRAVEKGKTRMVEAMIRAGADANETTPAGATPLLIAISLRQAETAAALLKFPEVVRGMNAHRNTTDPEQRTAFQLAVARGLHGIATTLIGLGADVNAPDADGWTPLRHAILQGNVNLVKALVENGADVAKVEGGRTLPILLAAGSLDIRDAEKRAEIVRYLLTRGADPDQRQPVTGMTPIALAIMVSNGLETARELLRHPIAKDHVDHEGFTPIYYTLQKPDTELLSLMIAGGADVNARHGGDARTPLIQAVHDNNIEGAKLLLAAGANPRLYDAHDRSALSYARLRKNSDMITLLESALSAQTPRKQPKRAATP